MFVDPVAIVVDQTFPLDGANKTSQDGRYLKLNINEFGTKSKMHFYCLAFQFLTNVLCSEFLCLAHFETTKNGHKTRGTASCQTQSKNILPSRNIFQEV